MKKSKAVIVKRDGVIDIWAIPKLEIPEILEIWEKEGRPKVGIVPFKPKQ